MCLLEAAAYLAGEDHTDHPACVSPVLAAFGRSINDGLFAKHLGELVPYAARLVGTVNPALEQDRVLAIVDWAVRDIAACANSAAQAAAVAAERAAHDDYISAACYAVAAAQYAAGARGSSVAIRASALALLDRLIDMAPA
jgi:hypothetical protein